MDVTTSFLYLLLRLVFSHTIYFLLIWIFAVSLRVSDDGDRVEDQDDEEDNHDSYTKINAMYTPWHRPMFYAGTILAC